MSEFVPAYNYALQNPELSSKIRKQMAIEQRYSDAAIRDMVREDLLGLQEIKDKIHLCITSVMEWKKKDFYDSKKARVTLLTEDTVENAIIDVLCLVCSEGRMQALTGVVGRCHQALPHEDYLDRIKTIAEIISHMCEADLIDIAPAHVSPIKIKDQGVIAVKPRYGLDQTTVKFIEQTMHLPPMICKPRTIHENSDCGYLTGTKPVILKHYNQHDGEIALDSINLFNSNEYSLDIEYLKTVNDVLKPSKRSKTKDLTKQQIEQWETFQKQSNHVYLEIIREGNSFWLTHHYDARGRTYAKGYHVSSMGTSFKKAMISWKESKPIEVSNEYKDLFGSI